MSALKKIKRQREWSGLGGTAQAVSASAKTPFFEHQGNVHCACGIIFVRGGFVHARCLGDKVRGAASPLCNNRAHSTSAAADSDRHWGGDAGRWRTDSSVLWLACLSNVCPLTCPLSRTPCRFLSSV
jgi:hypothetical protein